jgi:hypothetical protein
MFVFSIGNSLPISAWRVPSMARMKIFTKLEEEAFESPPVFNSIERKQYFTPLMLKDLLVDLRTPTNKVCFLLAAGYFKARRKFFGGQFRQTDTPRPYAKSPLNSRSPALWGPCGTWRPWKKGVPQTSGQRLPQHYSPAPGAHDNLSGAE